MVAMPGDRPHDLERVRDDLRTVDAAIRSAETARSEELLRVHPEHRADAINLVHYVALRRLDVRELQRQLAALGLSSLGRCEPHVMATVSAVHAALEHGAAGATSPDALAFDAGRAALDRNTDALLGPRPRDRVTRIMVTLPTEAADDPVLVRHLVGQGMDVARINGAHDGPEQWERMATHVRRATAAAGRPCRVSMDLPGPKLRTGPLAPGPEVLRFRPARDLRGVAMTPVAVTFRAASAELVGGDAMVPVDSGWLARRRVGDVLTCADTRGAARTMAVVECTKGTVTAEMWNTAYLERGTVIGCASDRVTVQSLPAVPQFHVVRAGDVIEVVRESSPAEPWRSGQPGRALIGCTLDAAFDAVRVGHRVAFDDAKITGVVESVEDGRFAVRVLTASPRGSKLRAEKGINLPDTYLPVPMVGESDRALLETAARCADMLALSFVRHEDDVDEVRRHLDAVGGADLGLIVKVETMSAFDRLPEILLRAMRARLVGVMIARGDLAVEVGYGRLAEIQEEILWLCEAGRLPVIWATEVLDHLARTGKPSRAEITDAAMSQRAECVMLNKGPHIDIAIEVLDEILRRMSGHQRKKSALLSPLRAWI